MTAPGFIGTREPGICLSSVSSFVPAGAGVPGWPAALVLSLVPPVVSEVALLSVVGVGGSVESEMFLFSSVGCSGSFPLSVIIDGSEEESSGALSLEAEELDSL